MKSLILIAAITTLGLNTAGAHILKGKDFPDRTTAPLLPAEAAELVIETETPAGNVTVSPDGRVFISFHDLGKPKYKVAEVIDGKAAPFPSEEYQDGKNGHFQTILGLRVDRFNRLWTLDFGNYGFKQPRLLAFDLKTKALVFRYDFPRDIVGRGAMLNDLHIDANARHIYMTDTSLWAMRPALLILDTETRQLRRILRNHETVKNQGYQVYTEGKSLLGSHIFHNVDPFGLDRTGKWLFFAPLNGEKLFKLPVDDVLNESLPETELQKRIAVHGEKTMSDGITTDDDGNVYFSDFEHSAIVRLSPDGKLETLLKDPRFRWPDGFSFAPGGWVYFTCAAIQDIMGKSAKTIKKNGPYQVYRFQSGSTGTPGH